MTVRDWPSRSLGLRQRRALSVPPAAADMLGAATLPGDLAGLPHVVMPITPAERFARCVSIVLHHEGGFVNHPRDPGGATNRGITLATLRDWRGEDVTAEHVRALTESEARAIYRARYWNPVRGDDLPAGVDLAVFDLAVNSGTGRAARMLQGVAGVEQDGAIGPRTLAAVRRMDPAELVAALCDARMAFLRGLSTFDTFGRGWTRRVDDVRARALAMIATTNPRTA